MKNVKLEKVDSHLREKLKNKEFKINYEQERVKVALAQKIAELRQGKKLRQIDLAKLLNVSQQFISQIETAQEKNLTVGTLIKIANSLERDIVISFPKTSGKTSHIKVA
ncbi:MAG: helix-turn-helix domain-containing protein [Candidatus Firestonebacteria bacterium]